MSDLKATASLVPRPLNRGSVVDERKGDPVDEEVLKASHQLNQQQAAEPYSQSLARLYCEHLPQLRRGTAGELSYYHEWAMAHLGFYQFKDRFLKCESFVK